MCKTTLLFLFTSAKNFAKPNKGNSYKTIRNNNLFIRKIYASQTKTEIFESKPCYKLS